MAVIPVESTEYGLLVFLVKFVTFKETMRPLRYRMPLIKRILRPDGRLFQGNAVGVTSFHNPLDLLIIPAMLFGRVISQSV